MHHSSQRMVPALLACCSLSLALLTGCGASTSFSNPSVSTGISGKVFGGQQPLSGSTVTVWAIGLTTYGSPATQLGQSVTTGTDGTFSYGAYTCPTATTQVYITASGGIATPDSTYNNSNIMLAVGLGDCSAAQTDVVEINEVTTVATAFALGQFFTTTLGKNSTDSFGTDPADLTAFTLSNTATIPMLVNIPDGTVNPNTSAITIESAKIYTLANILASCVNDAAAGTDPTTDPCLRLMADTTPPGATTAPYDTLQAAVQLSLYPAPVNPDLLLLAVKNAPFVGLTTTPNDWTIGVSYTTSALGLGIGTYAGYATSASIDIDALGKIWFPTNLGTTTIFPGIAYFDPTTTTFNGPYLNGTYTTPISDGGYQYYFYQPQYVAIDNNGLAWLTDQGPTEGTYGSVDTGSINNVTPGSSPTPYNLGLYTYLGPVASDGAGNVFFSGDTSYPDSGVFLYAASSGEAVGAWDRPPTGIVAASAPLNVTSNAANDYIVASTSATTSTTNTPCLLETPGNGALVTSASPCSSGGIAFELGARDVVTAATSLNQYCLYGVDVTPGCVAPTVIPGQVNLPEGLATDGKGNLWAAMSGNSSVLVGGQYPADGNEEFSLSYLHGFSNGNTMTTPYAIAIDGSGNVWIANAGCVATLADEGGCAPGPFVLSELIGAAGPTITPLSAQMFPRGYFVGNPPGTPFPSGCRKGPGGKPLLKNPSTRTKIFDPRC